MIYSFFQFKKPQINSFFYRFMLIVYFCFIYKKSEQELGEPLQLNIFEFANFFSEVLQKGSDAEVTHHSVFVKILNYSTNKQSYYRSIQYDELFKNIDVVQSGIVDWDKFASYILNTLYESDDRMNAFSIPNWKPMKQINK